MKVFKLGFKEKGKIPITVDLRLKTLKSKSKRLNGTFGVKTVG